MTALEYSARTFETRLRVERAERRGTLLASLGPFSKPRPMRVFSRRVVPLAGTIEVYHAPREAGTAAAPEWAA